MANLNPSPSTRFNSTNQPLKTGRTKGSRDRLSAAFLQDLHDDYTEHGKAVIQTVREQEPATYLRITASLLPKEIDVHQRRPLEGLTEEQLDELEALVDEVHARSKAKEGSGG